MDLPQTRRLTGTREPAEDDVVMADLLEKRLLPVVEAMVRAARGGDREALLQLTHDLDVATEAIHAQLPARP